jgi:hypothetical protein
MNVKLNSIVGLGNGQEMWCILCNGQEMWCILCNVGIKFVTDLSVQELMKLAVLQRIQT